MPRSVVTFLIASLAFSPFTVFAMSADLAGPDCIPSGAITSPCLYTGENLDPETNLIYLRARYYDPATGRFISRDPVRGVLSNPLTQNPYIYAGDNPITYTDPSGEFIPLLLLDWAAVEIGLTIWDGYDTVRTVTSDCATAEDIKDLRQGQLLHDKRFDELDSALPTMPPWARRSTSRSAFKSQPASGMPPYSEVPVYR